MCQRRTFHVICSAAQPFLPGHNAPTPCGACWPKPIKQPQAADVHSIQDVHQGMHRMCAHNSPAFTQPVTCCCSQILQPTKGICAGTGHASTLREHSTAGDVLMDPRLAPFGAVGCCSRLLWTHAAGLVVPSGPSLDAHLSPYPALHRGSPDRSRCSGLPCQVLGCRPAAIYTQQRTDQCLQAKFDMLSRSQAHT